MKTFFIFCLALESTKSQTLLINSVIESFQERSPVFCNVIIQDNATIDIKIDTDYLVPIYWMHIDQNLKQVSKYCQHHVILLNDVNSLKKINIQDLTLSTGKFAGVYFCLFPLHVIWGYFCFLYEFRVPLLPLKGDY